MVFTTLSFVCIQNVVMAPRAAFELPPLPYAMVRHV